MAQQIPTKFNQTSDMAALVSRGSAILTINIPDGFSANSNEYKTLHAEIAAPNADTFYVRMKSSRDNIWKCGRMFRTYYNADSADGSDALFGSALISLSGGKANLDIYFHGQLDNQHVPFGQTITAEVMFFDQPL